MSRLIHRGAIQEKTAGQDAAGQPLETWQNVASIGENGEVWVDIRPISGREYFAAQANQSVVQTKIKTRFVDGVLPSMRFLHGSTAYNIEAVLPEGRKWLWLMCTSGTNING